MVTYIKAGYSYIKAVSYYTQYFIVSCVDAGELPNIH